MSTVRQISVHVERKISRNYNSTCYSYGATVDVDPEEDMDTVFALTTDMLRDKIRKAYVEAKASDE